MKIPKSFTLFGNRISVREVEQCEGNRYGYWNDAKEEIVLAHKVKDEDGLVTLRQDQIEATFAHEFIHAMQWFSGREYDEVEAQTYSYMIMEFIRTSGINPVHKLTNESYEEN